MELTSSPDIVRVRSMDGHAYVLSPAGMHALCALSYAGDQEATTHPVRDDDAQLVGVVGLETVKNRKGRIEFNTTLFQLGQSHGRRCDRWDHSRDRNDDNLLVAVRLEALGRRADSPRRKRARSRIHVTDLCECVLT
jgi:hypothetical protein